VRLTIDLVPEITILVHREGEPAESAYAVEEAEEMTADFAELAAEEDMDAEAESEGLPEAVEDIESETPEAEAPPSPEGAEEADGD
jgi:hypothetical protein